MKQRITGVGLPQNLGLRFWLHDAAIKEGKRFTVKQKALLRYLFGILGIIADNVSKAAWTWGCISAVRGFNRQTIWIPDAQRDDGMRFVERADEKLTAFSGAIWTMTA